MTEYMGAGVTTVEQPIYLVISLTNKFTHQTKLAYSSIIQGPF